jgi:hypothetical protein
MDAQNRNWNLRKSLSFIEFWRIWGNNLKSDECRWLVFHMKIFLSLPILPSGTACSYAPEDIQFAVTLSTDDSGASHTL